MNETEHFKTWEFRCPCCGEAKMQDSFLEKLQLIRYEYGLPMQITSGYRCPEYNNQIASSGFAGPHTTGRAADILASGTNAYYLLKISFHYNMRGIGIYQTGPHEKRFLHLDDLLSEKAKIRPTIW